MAFNRTKFLSQFRDEVLERLETASQHLVELEKHPDDIEVFQSVMREFHTIKGITSLMGFDIVSGMFHKLEDFFRESGNLSVKLNQGLYDFLFKCVDVSKSVFKKDEIEDYSIADFADSIESELKILFFNKCADNADKSISGESTVVSDKRAEKKKEFKSDTQRKTDSIKVENSKLLKLVNLSSEMLIAKVMLNTLINRLSDNFNKKGIAGINDFETLLKGFVEVGEAIDKYSTEINLTAIHMRMISLDNLFNLYQRPIREIAKSCGKEVELVLKGENTLLDKDIINHIFDPVLHILRNAVDHGIESTEERKKMNKPDSGTIILNAYQKASQVYLEISDDGQGIDLKKLRDKILVQGLAEIDTVKKMSRKNLLDFLFHHGFSTKDSANMLSGRGLGLDVVKEKIEAVNGTVMINSEFERGTVVTLILPMTLIITESLLVEVGNEVFAIPTDNIKEVCRIDIADIKTVDEENETCIIDNESLPLVSLFKLLGIQSKNFLDKKLLQIVVVNAGSSTYCIAVDKIRTYIDTVVKPISRILHDRRYFTGATITGEGHSVLVLDISTIFKSFQEGYPQTGKNVNKVSSINNKNIKILLADDSESIINVEKEILESEGYSVKTATDGREAFEFAINENFDIVISDILMPRMNGIELAMSLRKDVKYCNTPIIMLTSRDNPEDMERALAAGANEYILKSKFTSAGILNTIRKLIK